MEKPGPEAAEKIIRRGALWNTLVTIFKATTMMNVLQRAMPDVYRSFQPLRKAIGTPDEQRVLEAVYHELRPINFSGASLAALPFELGRLYYFCRRVV